MKTKICKLCNIEKLVSEFYTRNDSKDGYYKECKCCHNKKLKQHRLKNRDKIIERNKQWRHSNKTQNKICSQCECEKPVSEFSCCQTSKDGYDSQCKSCKSNYLKRYYQVNKATINKLVKQYQQSPQGRLVQKTADHKKRMRKINNTPSGKNFTASDIAQKLNLQNHKCVYCKASLKDGYEIDHIIALSKGGSNEASNIQLLCRECNRGENGKFAKDITEFAKNFGMLF